MTLPEEAVKAAAVAIYNELARGLGVKATPLLLADMALTAALPFLSVQGAVKTGAVDTTGLVKALSRLAGNRHSDGVSSLVTADDRSAIIDGCYDLMVSLKSELSANACQCTKIQQDESCPVGYPSLLCEICDGKGVVQPSAARELALEEGFRQGVEAAANRCELSATLSQEQQDKESNPFIRNALMGEIATAKALAKNIRALSSPDHADGSKSTSDQKVCQTCNDRGIIGGMHRVGDGDVDAWEETCPDCQKVKAHHSDADTGPDDLVQIALHLNCEPDADSILHVIREIQADIDIAKHADAGKVEGDGWLPIESAPKDGEEFQAWIAKYGWEPRCRIISDTEAFEIYGRVDYDQDGWEVYPHMTPTHWLSLPSAPSQEVAGS